MRRLRIRLFALSALWICWGSAGAQELPPLPPGVVMSVTSIGTTNPATGNPKAEGRSPNETAKKVRTFAKACPECDTICVSTNSNTWVVSDGIPGGQSKRLTQVSFKCPCGDFFQETEEKPLRKTKMVEVTQ